MADRVLNTLSEFLDANAHRFYPLDPAFGSQTALSSALPPALLLDLRIISTSNLPDNSGTDTTYLSKVVTDGVHARLYLAYKKGGDNPVELGCIATIDAANAPGDRINFQSAEKNPAGGVIFEGFLIVGDATVLQQMPPVTTLDEDTGRLYTGCIQHMTKWAAGLKVGTEILGGVVELVAGAGVELTVLNNTIQISCVGAIPPENNIIVSDIDILNTLQEIYGTPITSINGVSITNGNWKICTKESEGLVVTAWSDNSITITNTLASACCGQESISMIVDNVAELNERVGLIQSFQNQLDTNLNILSAQMTKLG